ncbi:MAG: hypothetical protein P8129_06005 [Anaerolineae bacterium]
MNESVLCRTAARPAAALLLAILLAAGLASAAQAQAGGWTIECVDCPRYFAGTADRILRLDAAGYPHLAYGGDALYYTWYDGAVWHRDVVDDSPGVGAQAALDLDTQGHAHILYRDAVGNVKYAYQDDTGWHLNYTGMEADADSPLKLEVDSAGVVHAAYDGEDYVDYGLMYARREATGWQIQFVTNPGQPIDDLSLAINAAGEPRIAFCLDDGDTLGYMVLDGTTWQKQYTDTGTGSLYQVSLALEGDEPRLAYSSWSTVGFGYRDAGGWTFETVDAEASRYPSLALDGAGSPHIVYNGSLGNVLHAYVDAHGWQVEQVYQSGDAAGGAISAALDVTDGLSVAHVRGSDLLYTQRQGSAWHTGTVDTSHKAGMDPALALDKDSSVHVSYRADAALKYAHHGATGWQTEVVPTPPEQALGVGTALTLDPGGRPHIAYPLYDGLRYTYHDGAAWQTERINDAPTLGPSLALDSNDWPRVTYNDLSADGIRYAYRDGGGWHIQAPSPDSAWTVGYPSLAIDTQDRTHMSYGSYAGSPDPTLYARPEDTGWYTERIGTGSHFASLVLDDNDLPHVGYGDYPHYAHLDASGWQTETVSDDRGYYVEIALDREDRPYMAYIDYTSWISNSIKYAHRTDSGWQTQMVWSAPYFLYSSCSTCWFVDYLSLAVSPGGSVYIAFYDPYGRDLKLARRLAVSNQAYLPLVLRR